MSVEDHSQHRSGKAYVAHTIRRAAEKVAPMRFHDVGWLIALGFAAGAASFLLAPDDPKPWLGTGFALLGLISWMVIRRSAIHTARPIALGLALLVIAIGLGHARAQWRTASVEAQQLVLPEEAVIVTGWVIGLEIGDPIRIRLQVSDVAGIAPEQQPKIIRVSHRSDLRVKPGRFVSCHVQLLAPPAPSVPGDYAFARQSWFDGLDAVGFALGACRPEAAGPRQTSTERMALWLAAQRHAVAERIVNTGQTPGAALAATLITGDRSVLVPETVDALRASGLAHLLAISGLHMALAGGAVFFFLRRALAWIEPLALRVPVPKLAAAGALIACSVYLVFSGASVSAQRAYIMAVIAFGAILVDRPALSMRGLALAMLVVLLLHPEAVLTPGFQMSFAAAAALVASFGHDGWLAGGEGRGPIKALRDTAATSMIAGLATAPISAFHFAQLTVWGYLANLLAMPIVSFLSAPLAICAVALSLLGLGEWPMKLFAYSLDAVIAIAEWVASLPGARRNIGLIPNIALPLALGGIGLATAIKGKPGLAMALITAGAVFAVSVLGGVRPNVYVSSGGTIYAISGPDTWERFKIEGAKTGLGPMAIETSRKRPKSCGDSPCVVSVMDLAAPETQPHTVIIADTNTAMTIACGQSADLLLSRVNVDTQCSGPRHILNLVPGQGVALMIGKEGLSAKFASRSNRPWSRPIPASP
jgi:competence protein ComEC